MAIVSDRPQTTRRAIRGVHQSGDCQLVLVDLPGVQRPRDELTARMARRVQQELDGSDAALLMLSGEQGVGPGDRFIAAALAVGDVPVTVAVNKVDRLSRAALMPVLEEAAELGSARGGVPDLRPHAAPASSALVEHLASLMPEGPFMFSARREQRSVARAAAGGADPRGSDPAHVPGAAARRRGDDRGARAPARGLARVRALIWVESESQKGIVIGAHGRMIKAIGTAARRELQRALGEQVHLELSVRVRRDWRADGGCSTASGSPERDWLGGSGGRACVLRRGVSRSR